MMMGAIALFKRSDDGEFLCQQMYASGRHIPQSFWEAMYPIFVACFWRRCVTFLLLTMCRSGILLEKLEV